MGVGYGEAVEGLAEAGGSSRLTEGAKRAGVYCIDRYPLFKHSLKHHCFRNKVVSAVSADIKT